MALTMLLERGAQGLAHTSHLAAEVDADGQGATMALWRSMALEEAFRNAGGGSYLPNLERRKRS